MKRRILLLLVAIIGLNAISLLGQNVGKNIPSTFKNPIISGFHPDPSICRVGEDYYLVNSSFEWYPGLPIYHSKDLVNWELVGYGIHRPNQVELPEGLGDSRGVYAPTIRYYNGLFYIINTCVQCEGNFYITAENPSGPWSDPVWLHSRGIDPDLFWDVDGKCYYTGHANITGVNDWPQKNGAWMQELDLNNKKLVGPQKQLTHGHAKNARWTEGPHIYKIDGKYMLLVAEGGTGFHHSITVHHSDSIWGPYIPNHSNPVLTHRHLGNDYPVHSVGHGDLIQTQKGDWWFVGLGKRKIDGQTLLARETFLTPVEFQVQEGIQTPVFNPGIGQLSVEQKRPDLPWSPVNVVPVRDEFASSKLALQWNFLRTPYTDWYKLEKGSLVIKARPNVIDSLTNPSFIAQRIEHYYWEAATKVNFSSKNHNEQAGLVIYRRSTNHYQLLKEENEVVLIKTLKGKKSEIARVKYVGKEVIFKVKAETVNVQFYFGDSLDNLLPIGEVQDLGLISDEQSGGFNGPYIGMYVTSNNQKSKASAAFDWFEYSGK